MDESNFASYGLSVRETQKKREYGWEVTAGVYSKATGELIASFSTTIRTSDGDQILNTNTQFIQHTYLTIGQIRLVNQWLRERTDAARWRLSTYTTLVAARP
jgi:hypothetical protein